MILEYLSYSVRTGIGAIKVLLPHPRFINMDY